MILRKQLQLQGLLLFCALAAPSLVQAATRSEVINGATCIPYPPYQTNVAVPYQHWLYLFSQTAYCQLTMSDEWPVQNLSYVLFNVSTSSSLTARLCVHTGDLSVTCGASKTISAGGLGIDWVAPPSQMPQFPFGAFVQFTMPFSQGFQVSTIRMLIPAWYK